MSDLLMSLAFFVALTGAALITLFIDPKLLAKQRDDGTREVVRLCAGIFVVMTSLVLGLIVNSAKNTFESVDKNVHAYATELILLDRALKQFGPESNGARKSLLAYVKQAAARMAQDDPLLSSRVAEGLLNDVGQEVRTLRPADDDQKTLRLRAEQRLETVLQMRWALIEQSEVTIPRPLLVLVGGLADVGICQLRVLRSPQLGSDLKPGCRGLSDRERDLSDPRHGGAIRRAHAGLAEAANTGDS